MDKIFNSLVVYLGLISVAVGRNIAFPIIECYLRVCLDIAFDGDDDKKDYLQKAGDFPNNGIFQLFQRMDEINFFLKYTQISSNTLRLLMEIKHHKRHIRIRIIWWLSLHIVLVCKKSKYV